MRYGRCSRFTGIITGLSTGLLFAALAVPVTAQPANKSPFYYDAAKEVTLTGTVLNVFARAPRGMEMGAHLLLTTDGGVVDASLGRFGLQGRGALPVSVGDSLDVTGVMKTIGGKEVFVVRTVKAGGRVYTVRNGHGIPLSPQARERARQQIGQKGESL
jgi:hypothetical protein